MGIPPVQYVRFLPQLKKNGIFVQIYNQMSEAFLSKRSLTEQIFILFAIVIISMIGVAMFIALIATRIYGSNFDDFDYLLQLKPKALVPFKFLQMIYSICGFLLPAFIFSKMKSGNPVSYNIGEKKVNFMLLSLIPGILISFIPFAYVTHEMNQQIYIPWPEIEMKLLDTTKNSEALMLKFMEDSSPIGFAINFVMLAIFPALCEEFLFRGALQKILIERTRNFHIAIIISGVLFSVIHGDVYGFFPRAVLGILFGYLVYWGGSIWYSVAAHFLFNGMQAVGMYYLVIQDKPADLSSSGVSSDTILLSTALFLFLTYTFFRVAHKEDDIGSNEQLLE